jgi:hypothetical protein
VGLGGSGYPLRKKKVAQPDVFKEMEKTIYELLHPQEPVEVVAEAVTQPAESLDDKLNALLELAGESHALLQRAAQVRADIQAVAEARRKAAEQALFDDDEEAVLWLT